MSVATDIVLTAARATKRPDGSDAFATVLDRADVRAIEELPALFLIRRDVEPQSQPESGSGIETREVIQGVIYHQVRDVDSETDDEVLYTAADADALYAAFLYEILRDDPTDPDTGETGLCPRAPLVQIGNAPRGYNTFSGRRVYAIGFTLQFPSYLTPRPLT